MKGEAPILDVALDEDLTLLDVSPAAKEQMQGARNRCRARATLHTPG